MCLFLSCATSESTNQLSCQLKGWRVEILTARPGCSTQRQKCSRPGLPCQAAQTACGDVSELPLLGDRHSRTMPGICPVQKQSRPRTYDQGLQVHKRSQHRTVCQESLLQQRHRHQHLASLHNCLHTTQQQEVDQLFQSASLLTSPAATQHT